MDSGGSSGSTATGAADMLQSIHTRKIAVVSADDTEDEAVPEEEFLCQDCENLDDGIFAAL